MPETPPRAFVPPTTRSIVQDGTLNGDPARASTFARIADAVNSSAAYRGRVLLSRRVRTGQQVEANGTNPLFRYRYHDDNENGQRLVYHITFRPKNLAAGLNNNSPEIQDNATRVHQLRALDRAPSSPEDHISVPGILDVSPASGAAESRLIEVIDGFRLVSLTVYERPDDSPPYTLIGSQHFVEKAALAGGRRIVDTGALRDLSETQEEIFTRIRDCFQVCQPRSNAGGGGNGAPMTTFSGAFVNLIDGTAARTTSTAGFPVSALSGALGNFQASEVQCSVFAQATPLVATEEGRVRFVSSLGQVDINGIGGAAAWYDAASTLDVDTRAVNGDGRDWDKADLLGRVVIDGGAPELRVWAVRIEISPVV